MPDTLIEAARQVMAQSYSPYSKLRVGAAILSRDGTVFVGTNIENASYGHTICAERVAIFAAVSAGHRSFDKIAVVTDSPWPVSPCGACRQVLAEFGLDLQVYMTGRDGVVLDANLSDLLPHAFTPKDLPHPE
jgi:cytidine deaminase